MPDMELLRDFSSRHFSSINFSRLHFKSARYFATWIGEKKNVLLVSGSFGRSPVELSVLSLLFLDQGKPVIHLRYTRQFPCGSFYLIPLAG